MSDRKHLTLALQGGGAHGAYTWGVLDRLLEEPRLVIDAISGTSAGALNGAALKAGLCRGGAEAARENLNWLWSEIGAVESAEVSSWLAQMVPDASFIAKMMEASPAFQMAETARRMFSPYAFGPIYENPLARVVNKLRFADVCAEEGPALYISATNVRTGKIKLFTGDQVSTDAILASACLPNLFQAVEIEDPRTGSLEAYWDGGYTGNPALYPLFGAGFSRDMLIVNINPLVRDAVPKTPQDIQNRINEIGFNTSLLRELRAIRFVKRLIEQGAVTAGTMKDVLVHMVSDDGLMNQLSVATKQMPNPLVLAKLKEAGRAAAETFLTDHWNDLNTRSTLDLSAMFDES